MKPDDDLLLYWSNELEPAERAAVEARLRDDPEAAAYLDELSGLAEAMEALPRNDAPPSLSRRTIADFDPGSPPLKATPDPDENLVTLPGKPWFTHWMAIAAGLIAVALLVFLYARPDTTSPQVVEQAPPPPVAPSDANKAVSPSPDSSVKEVTSPTPSRVASRLFAKDSRFTSNGRFRAARERLQKLRSQLPNHPSPNEKA